MTCALVAGGSGFTDSTVIRYLSNGMQHTVVNVDKRLYVGNLESLISIEKRQRCKVLAYLKEIAWNQAWSPMDEVMFVADRLSNNSCERYLSLLADCQT